MSKGTMTMSKDTMTFHRCVRWLVLASVVTASLAAPSAQWLKHPDPKVPRTADGQPNLTAPAPRLPDGKPDFSGLWNSVDGRFLTNISRRAGVEPPFQPWAKKLFDERQANQGRDRPAGFCLPHGVPDGCRRRHLIETHRSVVLILRVNTRRAFSRIGEVNTGEWAFFDSFR